eukprot:2689525-Rhodomonas_salina.1
MFYVTFDFQVHWHESPRWTPTPPAAWKKRSRKISVLTVTLISRAASGTGARSRRLGWRTCSQSPGDRVLIAPSPGIRAGLRLPASGCRGCSTKRFASTAISWLRHNFERGRHYSRGVCVPRDRIQVSPPLKSEHTFRGPLSPRFPLFPTFSLLPSLSHFPS